MKVDRKLAEKNLQGKGFRKDKSRDHQYFFYYHNGQETGIKTYVSHSKQYRDIGPDNLESMKRQLKLHTQKQIIDLLTCPMTELEYSAHLVEIGILVANE